MWLAWTGSTLPEPLLAKTEALAKEYRFFHWPLEFPEVFFEKGGFDVVLGNPPWETMSPDAKEFFAPFEPAVRFMSPPDQKACIAELKKSDAIAQAWDAYCLNLYLTANFMKNSGRYTLFAEGNMGKGDFNIYRMFVEMALRCVRPGGRAAQFVPENLYNGANAAAIRTHLFRSMRLHVIIGFENTGRVWFDIDTRQKFCLYVAEPGTTGDGFGAAFNINSHAKALALKDRMPFKIPVSIVEEFSPDTLAISEVAHTSEVEVARKIYAGYPKFGSGWCDPKYRPYSAEMHMGNDRESFGGDADGIPVYEGRMVDLYDHRAKAYVSGRGRAAVWKDLTFGTKCKAITPQWRISEDEIPGKIGRRWQQYRVGFCDVASPTNQRALVSALIPPGVICGHKVPTIVLEDDRGQALLLWLGVANSLVIDFIARKKVALTMSLTLMDSLPLPKAFRGGAAEEAIAQRALLLSAIGSEMKKFWKTAAPPCKADNMVPAESNDERAKLRAEIDVLVARDLFGLTKEEMKYVLDPDLVLGKGCGVETFGALKRAEIREYGSFVTAERILSAWDTLPRAGASSARQLTEAAAR